MYTYIHIPFCKSKCTYCDFYSLVSCEGNLYGKDLRSDTDDFNCVPNSYIDALLNEASFYVNKYNIHSWKSIYVGGGTPALLTNKQAKKLFEGLYSLCPVEKNCEVTFEVNPSDLSCSDGEEYLQTLCELGVNRLSCGIQALDENVLKCINRRSSVEDSLQALELLTKWRKSYNAHNTSNNERAFQFSIDLISGLPKLTTDSFTHSLKTVLQYEPDHISLYSLTLEEQTPLYKSINSGEIYLDEDLNDAQWLIGKNILAEYQYTQYEVSNFSRLSECESEHNQAYWRMEDYIGLGCTACGTVGKNRYTGTKHINEYTKFWNSSISKEIFEIPLEIRQHEILTLEEQMFEFLMMGFRMLKGVDSLEFKKRFGFSLEEKIGSVYTKWKKKGLTKQDGRFYALNEKGILYLNTFLSEII